MEKHIMGENGISYTLGGTVCIIQTCTSQKGQNIRLESMEY